jgi:SAM-dependent methyltransferase
MDSKRCAALLALALVAPFAACAGQPDHVQAPAQAPAPTPDVNYHPMPDNVVTEMLKLARVTDKDVVYDLGCGDGRIVIAAAKQFGARGVCVEIDPELVKKSRANAAQAGVADRIAFLEQDLFKTDLRDATVVTLFLLPDLNLRLRPILVRDLKPGSRVASYFHDMGDWKPDETRDVDGSHGPQKLYLWTLPRKGP